MSLMHDYMDIGGRAKQDARAEEQLMTLPQNRETLAERSNLYTDWYKLAFTELASSTNKKGASGAFSY